MYFYDVELEKLTNILVIGNCIDAVIDFLKQNKKDKYFPHFVFYDDFFVPFDLEKVRTLDYEIIVGNINDTEKIRELIDVFDIQVVISKKDILDKKTEDYIQKNAKVYFFCTE